MNVVKPRARLEVRANFFSVKTRDDWNMILEVKMARSIVQAASKSCTSNTERTGHGSSGDGKGKTENEMPATDDHRLSSKWA